MTDLNVAGMAIAPNVVETIVSLAVKEVEGVELIEHKGNANRLIRGVLGDKAASGVEMDASEDERLIIAVHVTVAYGSILPDVAAKVRQSVADAVSTQVGIEVGAVDVYIDGVSFAN